MGKPETSGGASTYIYGLIFVLYAGIAVVLFIYMMNKRYVSICMHHEKCEKIADVLFFCQQQTVSMDILLAKPFKSKRRMSGTNCATTTRSPSEHLPFKGWGLSAKLGKHSAIWGKLGTALQAYALNPCTKFPPNPTSRKVNT